MTDPAVTTDEAVDGRRAWRERNRNAVVDALLDLYEVGNVRPSAEDIAVRSGVSRRSLFRYFDDMDELCRVAIDRHRDRVSHLLPVDELGEGSLDERLDRLVAQRLRLFRSIAPVARVARMRAAIQPILKAQLRADGKLLRRQLERHLEPELSALGAEPRALTLAAADLLTSFESFDFLTERSGLSAAEAGKAIRGALAALLAG